MSDLSEAFVGLDTSKLRNSVAIAEGGRDGEVRFFGEIENTPAAISINSPTQEVRLSCGRPAHDRWTNGPRES